MTVGIAAACESDDSPKAVVAADRMMTVQRASPIEFEHPGTKIKEIDHPEVNLVAVAAGNSGLSDRFFHQIEDWIQDDIDIDDGRSMKQVKSIKTLSSFGAEAFNMILREKINSQALNHLGINLSDIKNSQNLDSQLLRELLNDVQEKRENIIKSLHVLFVGVDQHGSQIYELTAGDYVSRNSLGYAAIGSGMQPAQSQFIYNQYGKDADLEEAIRSVTAAKMQSEEAQGVGEKTDMRVIDKDGVHTLNEDKIEELRDIQDEIEAEKENARENVIQDHDINEQWLMEE